MIRPRAVLRDGEGVDGGGGTPPSIPDPPAIPDNVSSELDRMRQDIAGIRDAVQNRPVLPPQPPAPDAGTPDVRSIEKEFWKNPLTVTAAISQHAVAQALQATQGQTHDTLVEVAKQQARNRLSSDDADLFDAYKGEIEQVVGTLAPQFQTNVNVWSNATTTVFGRHIADIVKIKAKKNGAPSPSGDGPAPPSTKGAPAPVKTPLTPEEKQWAKNWDITEDEYRHGKEILDDQDKHFEEVLTFDSKRKARKERERAAAK